MKRTVYGGKVINCGRYTCGQCKQISGRRCLHFDVELQFVDYGRHTTFARTIACVETEKGRFAFMARRRRKSRRNP